MNRRLGNIVNTVYQLLSILHIIITFTARPFQHWGNNWPQEVKIVASTQVSVLQSTSSWECSWNTAGFSGVRFRGLSMTSLSCKDLYWAEVKNGASSNICHENLDNVANRLAKLCQSISIVGVTALFLGGTSLSSWKSHPLPDCLKVFVLYLMVMKTAKNKIVKSEKLHLLLVLTGINNILRFKWITIIIWWYLLNLHF